MQIHRDVVGETRRQQEYEDILRDPHLLPHDGTPAKLVSPKPAQPTYLHTPDAGGMIQS